MIDIEAFLQDKGIPYVTEGNNVKKGHINIQCPFCGRADRSQHCGINKENGYWACWRNSDHRGRSLPYLISKVMGCSVEVAKDLLHEERPFDDVRDRLKSLGRTPPPKLKELGVQFGPDLSYLLPIGKTSDTRGAAAQWPQFIRYLLNRGFSERILNKHTAYYELQVACRGRWKNRIVFPVRDLSGKLVGHTGRCIDGGSLRYLSHPGPEVKKTVLWLGNLVQVPPKSKLVIVEGPMDALKLDMVARDCGLPARATCLFGTSYTVEQLATLLFLLVHFSRIEILLDPDAFASAVNLRAQLQGKATLIHLPREWEAEDPGALSLGQAKQIMSS